jgi:O-antigen ligase
MAEGDKNKNQQQRQENLKKNEMRMEKIRKIFSGEVFFALFLVAGYFKADHRLMIIQSYFDVTMLFLFLSFFSFIKRFLKSGLSYKMPENFVVLSALFFGVLSMILLGLIYTPSKIQSFDKALRFTFITGWAFFGAIFIIRDIDSLRLFLSALITVAIVMSIDAALSNYNFKTGQFITAFGSNYIALARISGVALLAVISIMLIDAKGKINRTALLAVCLLLLWSLMSAGARGPVIAFGLSMVVFLLWGIWVIPEIKIERFGLKLFIAMAIISSLFFIFFNRLGMNVIVSRFLTLVQEQGGGSSALQRWDYYQHAVKLIKIFPLFGQGTGSFGLSYLGEDIRVYPHNILLELWAENGIISVVFFLIMIAVTFGKTIVKLLTIKGREREISKSLLTLGCFMFFNSMFSGDINDNRILFTFLALNGVQLSFQKDRDKKYAKALAK